MIMTIGEEGYIGDVSKAQTPEEELAYYAAIRADKDWTAELELVFGNDACNARYEPRGASTPTLAHLYTAKRSADKRLHEAWSNLRREPPPHITPRPGGHRQRGSTKSGER